MRQCEPCSTNDPIGKPSLAQTFVCATANAIGLCIHFAIAFSRILPSATDGFKAESGLKDPYAERRGLGRPYRGPVCLAVKDD